MHFFTNKKGVVSFALTVAAGYHTLDSISTNDPRTKREVSVRLTLESLESGSFRTKIRAEDVSTISNFRSLRTIRYGTMSMGKIT